ncbi:MAG TPA: hypothetical protein VHQ65_03630 [Thermoanaerobaculia bacterium]|nr:hypothetical protein [Thermoanaerobaculia bacterium]
MRRVPPTPPLLLLAFLLTALPAAAEITVTVEPNPALWWETPVVRVTSDETAVCEQLSEPQIDLDFDLIRLILTDQCPDPAPPIGPHPLSALRELPRLYPGEYTLQVTDQRPGAGEPVSVPFSVHRGADLRLVPPAEPVLAGDDVILLVEGIASSSCFGLFPEEIDEGRIVVGFDDSCPLLPPGGPHVFQEPVPVGPLAAGTYEVLLHDYSRASFDGLPELARAELVVHDPDACLPTETTLCLAGGRFRVEIAWSDFTGGSGEGRAIPLAERDDTGLFWFFDPDNVELTVKVLDGCAVNGHWWVFLASGSTVGYQITVEDTAIGRTRQYDKAARVTPELIPDTAAFSCDG